MGIQSLRTSFEEVVQGVGGRLDFEWDERRQQYVDHIMDTRWTWFLLGYRHGMSEVRS